MAPLRFGLVGTSYWALHAHGTALSASPHADLSGVWGRDPVKAEELAQRLGVKSYADFDQLLSEVDAVEFSVPPDIQADLAVRAARAGCHLVLEKPLALSVPGAEAVVGAIEEAGVAALVFFTSRFRPSTEEWTQEAAEAGPWHSAHLVQYANIFQPGNPFGGSVWRRERGALWDVGPHALAGILPVMGPVTSVAARRGPAESDTVHLVLTHGREGDPAGPVVAASTVSLSLTIPPAAITSQLVFYGERGARARPEDSFESTAALQVLLAELAQMVESGQRRHRCDAQFGLEVVRVLVAAEEALDLAAVDVPAADRPALS